MLMLSHFFSPLFHHTCHMSFPYTRTCMTNTKLYQMFRLHQQSISLVGNIGIVSITGL